MIMHKWLLPEYIEDLLPGEAARVERLRRRILDLFFVHGYELVVPPMLEYVESLLTGTGHDLDLRTFKLVDQLSGRMLGVRADITPQVARIDAHLMNRKGVKRLCYAGSVLHTQPSGSAAHARAAADRRRDLRSCRARKRHRNPALMLRALQAPGVERRASRYRPRRGVPRARYAWPVSSAQQEAGLFQCCRPRMCRRCAS